MITPDKAGAIGLALVAKERIPIAPAARTRDQNFAATLAQKQKEAGWEPTLKLSKEPRIEGNKIAGKTEQIGIKRDPATGAKDRSPAEQLRYEDAQREANLVTKYLEKGYDDPGLTGVEKGKLIKKVLAEAKLRPEVRDQIQAMNGTQRREWAERYLRNPQLMAHARTLLEGVANSDPIADAVTPAQNQHVEAELKHKDAKDDVDRRLDPVDNQLKDYDSTLVGGVPLGKYAQEIVTITSELSTIQTKLKAGQKALTEAQDKLQDLREERELTRVHGVAAAAGRRDVATLDPLINDAKKAEGKAQSEVDKHQVRLDRLDYLKKEQTRLETEKKELEKEKRDKNSELRKAEAELQKRKQEWEDAKALRESQEQDVVSGFKNIVGEATNELLNEQVTALEEHYNTELENLKEQTPDLNEKAMYDALQNRWLGPARTRGGFLRPRERYRPINRGQVSTDMGTLMNQGPDVVMRQLLESQTNPATGNLYTAAEAEVVVRDKAYREKMEPEVVKQLLGRRILTGGLSQEDIHLIVNARWGQGMIDGAITKNKEFRKAVEGVLGEGALSRQGFFERFGQVLRTQPWLLMLLLGGTAAVALGPLGLLGAAAAPAAIGARAAGMAPMEEQIAA